MILGGEVTATESVAPKDSLRRNVMSTSSVAAINIIVRWGDWVMSTHELSPPRPFVVGEQDCDVTLPAEIIGAPQVPVLLARWDGNLRLIVPSGARVLIAGQTKRMSAARCIARGFGQSSTDVPDAAEVQLHHGQTVTLFFKSVAIDVELGTASPRTPRAVLLEKRVALTQLGSLVFHAFLLAIMMVFMRPLALDDDEGISDDQRFELQQRLNRLDEKKWDLQDDREGYKRRASRNERRLQRRLAARQDEWMDMLGASGSGWTANQAAEAVRDEAPPGSDRSVIGVLYDWPKPEPTTRPGAIPKRDDRPVTVTLPGDSQTGGRQTPRVRMGATSVTGRLPPEVVQRIVRQNFGRFRLCYEIGLRNNPNLIGHVAVRFVIGRDGAVSNVSNGGTDLPDGSVINCVVRAFNGLTFPQPESGIVTVVYPIMFMPG